MSDQAPTIALVTALPREFAAMRALLDDPREDVQVGQGAGRRYTRGFIPARGGGHHDLVLAVLPDMGTNAGAIISTRLQMWYPTVRNTIMVGIAGGVPHPTKASEHVRLGDIVVSDRYGVVQYDLVKDRDGDLEHRAPPRPPSAELLEAVRFLQSDEAMGERPWLRPLAVLAGYGMGRPDPATDVLGSTEDPRAIVAHPDDPSRLPGESRVFYGPIASANVLLKNPERRDALRDRFGVKAVEMEGSGIADASWTAATGYLVVRGVCDYCDANKTDLWHPYAAATAAAYVRALLESMPAESAAPAQTTAQIDTTERHPPPAPSSRIEFHGPTYGVQIGNENVIHPIAEHIPRPVDDVPPDSAPPIPRYCPVPASADLTSDAGTQALAAPRVTIREASAAEILGHLKGLPASRFSEHAKDLYIGRWTQEAGWQATVRMLPSQLTGGDWHCTFEEIGSGATFFANSAQDLSTLRPGDWVTVSGRIREVGLFEYVSLENAIVRVVPLS